MLDLFGHPVPEPAVIPSPATCVLKAKQLSTPLAIANMALNMLFSSLLKRGSRLSESESYNLLFLIKKRCVAVHALGRSITLVDATITNYTYRTLQVEILPGTCFVANGNYQNMAARRANGIILQPQGRHTLTIDVVCINADKPIPISSNTFAAVRSASPQLSAFLAVSQHCRPMVVQAGVWHLTDNLTAVDMRSRLKIQDELDAAIWGRFSQHPSISFRDIAEASQILVDNGLGSGIEGALV